MVEAWDETASICDRGGAGDALDFDTRLAQRLAMAQRV
jgi:hypothetical protein